MLVRRTCLVELIETTSSLIFLILRKILSETRTLHLGVRTSVSVQWIKLQHFYSDKY